MGFFSNLFLMFGISLPETVMSVDNIVVIDVDSRKRVELADRKRTVRVSLILGGILRIVLLFVATLLMHRFSHPFWSWNNPFGLEDVHVSISPIGLILIIGSGYLAYTVLKHMIEELDIAELRGHGESQTDAHIVQETKKNSKKQNWLWAVFCQLGLNFVFSLDSVLTAVTLTNNFWVMAGAVAIAAIAMVFFAEPLCQWVNDRPVMKMGALGFVGLVSGFLFLEGFGQHVAQAYLWTMGVYGFALAFLLESRRSRVKAEYIRKLTEATKTMREDHLLSDRPSLVEEELAR